jgi:hypothetical protein
MKSLKLFPGGKDKCVIRVHPLGKHLKFEIRQNLKDPVVLPIEMSCSTLSYAAT